MSLTPLYWLIGLFLAVTSWRAATDAQGPCAWARAALYGCMAVLFLAGDVLPRALVGGLVLVVAVLAGFLVPAQVAVRSTAPARPRGGSRLLWPILFIPALTLLLSFGLPHVQGAAGPIFTAQSAALYGLALACVLSLVLACRVTREAPISATLRGADLLESIGWAVMLPLLLAMLGSLFAKAGVAQALAQAMGTLLPLDRAYVAVLAYGLGMAALTMAMGNAFAAFPVIAGGIGLPYLVQVHGADPAPLAAIGMLCGYCGTLLTPMAANFNLVPAALLELKDRNGVIAAQVGTALPLLAGNLILLGLFCW